MNLIVVKKLLKSKNYKMLVWVFFMLIVLASCSKDDEPEEVGDEDAALDLDEPEQEAPAAVIVAAEPEPAGAPAVIPAPAPLPALGVDNSDDDFGLSIEKRPGFPAHILFEPGALVPTRGWTALSGAKLKAPYVGLIMKLTRDSARHFEGGTGTANISIPVAVAETFRFGVFPRSGRPRAEFSLRLRFHSAALRVERLVAELGQVDQMCRPLPVDAEPVLAVLAEERRAEADREGQRRG